MRLKLQSAVLCLAIALSACSGSDNTSGDSSDATAKTSRAADATKAEGATVAASTLADGPDVCFRAIAKHLGADTKVSEITSFFSVGSEIDSNNTKPAGEMTNCTVKYQSPDDPRKLVSTGLDIRSGKFDAPKPIEIRVTGGNAAEFKLDDYLIPLSKINAAALASVMEAQKARLNGVYSRYAWSGVRLSPPDPFSDTHTLRLDVEGRLASNDIKENGYASVSTDGKKITSDHLTP